MTEEEFDENIVTLTDEDGVDHDFQLIDIITVEEADYAILQPVEDENDEAIILKIVKDDEGNPVEFVDIEDDEEWEKVADAWEEMLEEEV